MIEAARALDEAHACGDWACMSELVTALAPQLQAWAATGPLSRAERQAMLRLRAVHNSASNACAANLDSLAGQMAAMRDNKDGWLAYALAGDTESA